MLLSTRLVILYNEGKLQHRKFQATCTVTKSLLRVIFIN